LTASMDQSHSATQIELNGINVIAESERRGIPRDLFWPWCGSNLGVLGVSYGSFFLGFGVSFWQATIAGCLGIIISFLLVGFVSLSGKRGSAPTMILSRAAFGVRGGGVPATLSYLLLVGWETALVSLATLATATVFTRLGWGGGTGVKIVAFLVVAALVVAGGIWGFDLIMRAQTWMTVILALLTVGYIALTVSHIHWSTVSKIPSGSAQAFIGTLVFAMTGFGLGWVNCGGDYSRYLPRSASGGGVIWWTTFGGSLGPVVLGVFGLLLAGSSTDLNSKIAADPIGALSTILPTWYLVPFMVVAIVGLIAAAVLDIYSSGIALLIIGLKVPRWKAALVDGIIMIAGTIFVVFIASNFFYPFEEFLITLGVPIAAWCGQFLADMWMRKQPYADADLYDAGGRYGAWAWGAIAVLIVGTIVGWGLVTNATSPTSGWFNWQGFLLGPVGLGGKSGSWAYANLGVLVAIAIGFIGQLIVGRGRVRSEESQPATSATV
jgi:nucleobase:cation symporter-1, NCS1 family